MRLALRFHLNQGRNGETSTNKKQPLTPIARPQARGGERFQDDEAWRECPGGKEDQNSHPMTIG